MESRRYPLLARFLLLTAALSVPAPPAPAIEWPSLSLFGGGGGQPGTPDWWAEHKFDAVHEPGRGYRVPGFEGYFDGDGRRMDAPTDEVVASFRAKEEAPGGLLPGLDPKRNFQRVREAVGGGPDREAASRALAEGRRLHAEKRYSAAVSELESAAQQAPGTRIEEEALFLIAESHLLADRLIAARDGFDLLVSRFPSTTRLDTLIEHQWKIAQYWEKYHFEYRQSRTLQPNLFDKTRPMFDTIGQAVKTYDSIRLNDPTGPRADDAVMATASIYFRRQRYEDADYHYTLLRRDYPRSEWQFEAHLLGLQAKLQMYQGPDYDGAPVDDAKKLVERIRTNFAGRITPEEEERLRLVEAKVRAAIEQRDLGIAQYYDNLEQYGAARQIYAQITRDHGQSPVAQRAAARLAQLGGLPDSPEKPFSTIVALLPKNRQQAKFSNVPEVRAAREGTRLASNPSAGNPAAGGGAVVPATATTPVSTTPR